MARVTVEDSLNTVDNQFELVLLASKRARDLAMNGADAQVEWEKDKATVVALREIAEGYINKDYFDLRMEEQKLDTVTATDEEKVDLFTALANLSKEEEKE